MDFAIKTSHCAYQNYLDYMYLLTVCSLIESKPASGVLQIRPENQQRLKVFKSDANIKKKLKI